MAQLLAMLQITIAPKFSEVNLVTGLTHQEFRCQCVYNSCHYTLISQKLLDAYKIVREDWAEEIIVNSGFRCQKHNSDIPDSSAHSHHTMGMAIDIRPKISSDLAEFYHRIVALDVFNKVIRYKTFIHCHVE